MNLLKFLGGLFFTCLIIGGLLSQITLAIFVSFLPKEVIFVALNPYDGFLILIWCGLAITLLLFMFFAGFSLSVYYKDALYEKEKKFILKNVIPSGVLFVIGLVFGFFLYTQIMLPFFVETNLLIGLTNYWNLYSVISSGIGLSIALGLSFQMPLVIRGLIKFKFVEAKFFREKRLIVIFLLLLISGIITPTPDVLSQLIVAIPLYLLFELSLIGLK